MLNASGRASFALFCVSTLFAAQGRAADETAVKPSDGDQSPGEEIVITATRSPRPVVGVPTAVTVIPRAEIQRSPAKTLDELLVSVPSFALFRRSSSMAADPSSQGVTLRGVGPSGVSRSLVLVDGIPLNDPFGGWVYWRAIPRIGIERLEIVPSGGSSLYGNYALAGVIQVISRPIEPLSVEGNVEAGSFGTAQVGLRAARRYGAVSMAVEGEGLNSDGYAVALTPGKVDGLTPSRHAVVNGRVEVDAATNLMLGLRAGYFAEDENGGTQYTTAGVHQFQYAATATFAPKPGAFDLAVFGHAGSFVQDRARFAGNRDQEFRNAHQDVPMHDLGASLSWLGKPLQLAGAHTLSAGVDARWITAETHEEFFPAAQTPTALQLRDASGEQRLFGGFVQDLYDVSSAIQLSGSLRFDGWTNLNAERVEQTFNGSSKHTPFAMRHDTAASPRLAAAARPFDWVKLRAAVFRSFRAPSLNELYRPFQVGTVLTNANENLAPETLNGAEAGFDISSPFGLAMRFTAYRSQLMNPITNVTLNATTRQRQNLGEARIQGIETDVGWRFARYFLASAAWTVADSLVTDAPGQPNLVHRQLLQDPKQRGTFTLSFDDATRFTAQVQMRYVGKQFEDDVNSLPMASVVLFDVFASWHLTTSMDVFLAADNLFDRTYLVGRAGLDTIGQPRFVHGGVRFRTN